MPVCANCGKERPTSTFLPDGGGAMAWTHGMSAEWCKVCIVEKQLKHARERADAIPGLEQELMEARAEAIADDVIAGVK